jgi:hypothetical protein
MKPKAFNMLLTKILQSGVVLGLGMAASAVVMAQISVNIPGVNVKTGKDGVNVSMGSGNDTGNTAGSIDADAEIEGVTVINDEVWIDGDKVPKGKTRHTGKKSGIKYKISWGKNGNIAVSQE